MVLDESGCWRLGTRRRGPPAPRGGVGAVEAAIGAGGPTAVGEFDSQGGSTTAGGFATCLGGRRDFIACSFSLRTSHSIIHARFFHRLSANERPAVETFGGELLQP